MPPHVDGPIRVLRPRGATTVAWTAGGVALAAGGIALFGLVSVLAGRTSIVPTDDGGSWALLAALTVVLAVLHELVHGAVMRACAARPTFGVTVAAGILPSLYCTAVGHWFTRRQYVLVGLAPGVLLSLLGAALVAATPPGSWLVVPLGAHLGGCAGDLWLVGQALRQPAGTLVEDRKDGVAFSDA